MKYSIIVPVYNRPQEVDELLGSLTSQSERDFEVIVVEDGSANPCRDTCDKYASRLDLHYYAKTNSGPAASRNYGAALASGDYLLILDSDVVLPKGYIHAISEELGARPADAFGGPDRAGDNFTDTQKAISYSMTSFFTTGGIRGGKKKLDKFFPRSFNMGIRRDVYNALGGFADMRFGEDIDFSIRLFESGHAPRLFPEAWVWHKRRTDLRKFFRQVYNSGMARINLYKKHPASLKLVHLLPAAFTIGTIVLVVLAIVLMVLAFTAGISPLWALLPLSPLLLYALLLFSDASLEHNSLRIGCLAVAAAFTQLMGYGLGFVANWWKRCVLRKGDQNTQAFRDTFYK